MSAPDAPASWVAPQDPDMLSARLTGADDPAPPQGFILWLTGLSGAGKTTVAGALYECLHGLGRLEILDGDEIRNTLTKGLSFSKEDRDENVFRIGYVARLLARNGVATIVSAISPYRGARDAVRQSAGRDGTPFVEVFVDASIDVLIHRDVKGLYQRALSGELPHFTGISDPYEPPADPDLRLTTDRETIDCTVGRVLELLEARDLLSRWTTAAAAGAGSTGPGASGISPVGNRFVSNHRKSRSS
jgi:adenylylsulfate kinase